MTERPDWRADNTGQTEQADRTGELTLPARQNRQTGLAG